MSKLHRPFGTAQPSGFSPTAFRWSPAPSGLKVQKVLHPEIQMEIPLSTKILADDFKEAGYATAAIGKWHVGGRGSGPPEHGFELFHPGRANTTPSETEGGKGEYDLTAAAEKFIEDNRARPFFVYLAHNTPHIPYAAQKPRVDHNTTAFEPVYGRSSRPWMIRWAGCWRSWTT